jgi:phosphoglycolate phosphatase-like HAD superfamily hydrolase
MGYRGVIVDLDDTLVDTRVLRPLREARRWREAVSRIGETTAFAGVVQAFSALTRAEIPWTVVTTSVSYYAEAVLRHHGLECTHLIAYHDAPPKPRPDGLTLALGRMELEPSEVVGVGDSEIDLRAYRAARVSAFGAAWSPTLVTGDWDGILAEPKELCDLVFNP